MTDEIKLSEIDLTITKGTLDKVIAALPEDSLSRDVLKIARNSLDKVLKAI